MPRTYQEQVTSRPLSQSSQQRGPEQAQVFARPVGALVSQAPVDNELNGLVDGLKSLNPALERWAAESDQQDLQHGAVSRLAGEEEPTWKYSAFAKGYMDMDGRVKGTQDASKLIELYSTEFDKDQPPEALDLFLRGKYGDMAKGLKEGDFLTGYDASIAPTLQKIRQDHLQYHQKKVVDTVESNAMMLLDSGIKGYMAQGQEVPHDFVEGLRKHMGENMGVDSDRFDQLLFSVVDRAGKDGNLNAFDILHQPKADGTPGMYFSPQWKAKIDSAELEASTRAEHRNRVLREDKQDQALYEVFDMLYSGNREGARSKFEELRKGGLFTRASDLKKWEDALSQAEQKEVRPDQQATETDLLTGIYQSKVGPDQILGADITNAQRKSLLNEWYRVDKDRKDRAAQQGKEEKAIYKTPEFLSGKDYIEKMTASTKGLMDPDNSLFEMQRRQQATAILEFTQFAETTSDRTALVQKQHEIVDRVIKAREQMAKGQPQASNAPRRYTSPQEVANAYRQGLLTTEEAGRYRDFFKANQEKHNAR